VVQAVHDCNLILSPFLPFSANQVDRALGGVGEIAPMPRIAEVDDLDGGPGYPVIIGDYAKAPTWQRNAVVVGAVVPRPSPIFTKLDESVVTEELARLGLDEES
jgi:methionyl-tRNA synthetase